MSARPMSPPPSRSGTQDPRVADEKLRLVEKIIQGRDFTCMAETRQRGRSLARLAARPCLRQCPPAADLHAQSRPHDPAVGGVGGAGTGRAFRCAPPALWQDRRLDPVPVVAPCRRRRPHAGRRPDRRGQVRAAGADGAAVPPLRRARSSPSTSAARSARQRSPWAATGTISAARLRSDDGEPARRHDVDATWSRFSRSPASMTRRERAWAADWIVAILTREGVAVTPEVKEHIWTALTSLASRARRGTHHHRPRRAAPVQRPEAGPAALLRRRSLRPAARRRERTSRRGVGPGLRDRRV